jgi:hypothetical protein
MAIKAVFPMGTNLITVSGLFQWDYGQVLEIEAPDIGTEVMEVHFACANMREAIVRSCSFSNGVGTVTIPDQCLEQASTITAWVYRIVGTQGHTEKVINLVVTARTRPSVVREIPQEIGDKYTELITEVNEAVENLESGNVKVSLAENATTAGYASSAGNATSAVYATSAGSAQEATHADKATKDGEGNNIFDSYIRWSDQPLVTVHTTKTIASGFGNKTTIGNLPQGQSLDRIVTLSVSIARTTNESDIMKNPTFVGHKTKSVLTDENGDYVEFCCSIQGQGLTQDLDIGSMLVRLYCVDSILYLVFVSGVYTRLSYHYTDDTTPANIYVSHRYDISSDHRYGTIRCWFV